MVSELAENENDRFRLDVKPDDWFYELEQLELSIKRRLGYQDFSANQECTGIKVFVRDFKLQIKNTFL